MRRPFMWMARCPFWTRDLQNGRNGAVLTMLTLTIELSLNEFVGCRCPRISLLGRLVCMRPVEAYRSTETNLHLRMGACPRSLFRRINLSPDGRPVPRMSTRAGEREDIESTIPRFARRPRKRPMRIPVGIHTDYETRARPKEPWGVAD